MISCSSVFGNIQYPQYHDSPFISICDNIRTERKTIENIHSNAKAKLSSSSCKQIAYNTYSRKLNKKCNQKKITKPRIEYQASKDEDAADKFPFLRYCVANAIKLSRSISHHNSHNHLNKRNHAHPSHLSTSKDTPPSINIEKLKITPIVRGRMKYATATKTPVHRTLHVYCTQARQFNSKSPFDSKQSSIYCNFVGHLIA